MGAVVGLLSTCKDWAQFDAGLLFFCLGVDLLWRTGCGLACLALVRAGHSLMLGWRLLGYLLVSDRAEFVCDFAIRQGAAGAVRQTAAKMV